MLALVTEAYGGKGGIAQYNRDLLGALAAGDDAIAVDILPRQATVPIESLPAGIVQRPPRRGKARFAAEAFRIALSDRPSIIFCGHLYMAPLCAFLARATGAALVIQLHGIEIWTRPTLGQRRALESATLILCVSRYTRAEVLKYAAIPPHRIRVQANTYCDDFIPGDRAAARHRFGIAGGTFCVLSVGRLDARERYKGQDRVIRALPSLRARHPDVVYLISGEGDDLSRLEALAQKAGVSDAVRFLGHVPREALPDLYRAADLFALPSTREGFGIVFLEAMACGTPALGLAVAGARDALADGMLGAAPEESELDAALEAAMAENERNDIALAQAVKHRFGRAHFAAHATRLFDLHGLHDH